MTAPPARPLYRAAEMSRLFAPRSIAVVGASANPAAFGSATVTSGAAAISLSGSGASANAVAGAALLIG